MKHVKIIFDEDTRGAVMLLHIGGGSNNWMFTFTGDMIRMYDSCEMSADDYWWTYHDRILDILNELTLDWADGIRRDYTLEQELTMAAMSPLNIN